MKLRVKPRSLTMMGLDGAKGPGSGEVSGVSGECQGSARAMDSWCGGWGTTNAALPLRRWHTGSSDPCKARPGAENKVAGEADAAS